MDLSKLSKKQKLELLDILERKGERDRRKKPPLIPNSVQARVLGSTALERYLFCANGVGKTTILVNELEYAAKGYNPITKQYYEVPNTTYLVVDDPGKIAQSIIPEYRKWHELEEGQLHKDGKPFYSRISYENGSVVHVLTHEVNMLKAEGVQMDRLLFDEPPPQWLFQALYRGGRKKGRPLQILMAGTPITQAWLRTDIYEPWVDGKLPHVECFKGRIEENKDNLEEGYIERFAAILNEHEKGTRLRGDFFDLSGQALARYWQPAKHVIKKADLDWDEGNPCVISVDPHPSKETHAVLLGADRYNRLVVLDEYKEKAAARAFTHSLIKLGWFSNYRVIDIVYDDWGNGDTTGGEGFRPFGDIMNEVLKKAGIGRARATTHKDKSDEEFMERIMDVLQVPNTPDNTGQCLPKLRVVDHCRGLERDIKQVQWQRDKKLKENKNKLEISNTDYLACLKYALATNLYFRKTKAKMLCYNKPAYGFSLRRHMRRGVRRSRG